MLRRGTRLQNALQYVGRAHKFGQYVPVLYHFGAGPRQKVQVRTSRTYGFDLTYYVVRVLLVLRRAGLVPFRPRLFLSFFPTVDDMFI